MWVQIQCNSDNQHNQVFIYGTDDSEIMNSSIKNRSMPNVFRLAREDNVLKYRFLRSFMKIMEELASFRLKKQDFLLNLR